MKLAAVEYVGHKNKSQKALTTSVLFYFVLLFPYAELTHYL